MEEIRHTREGDAIAAARRRLPMVEVDATIQVIGPDGPITILDCQVRELSYIHSRDATYAVLCKGPYEESVRTARVRAAVHAAVADLVAAQPWGELNIPMIAQRSGVHQATIYRRWGTLSGLLNDVVTEQLARIAPIPDTGSLRGDLERYAAEAAGHMAGPLGALVLRTAVSDLESGPRTSDDPAVAARRRRFQPMLERAAARGEHPPSVADLEELLLAPLYFHTLFSVPLQPGDARRLVDRLLAVTGCREPH